MAMSKEDFLKLKKLGDDLFIATYAIEVAYDKLNYGADIFPGTLEDEIFEALDNVRRLARVTCNIFPYPPTDLYEED